jgi:HK97 family phage prohead protease
MKNLEIRSFGGDAAPKIEGRTIEGYAIVFNQRSEVMLDWSAEEGLRRFVEVISPTAISDNLLQQSDIKALVEHNRQRLLARYNKGKGTLELAIDEHGLRYKFDAPNTADGDYAVEMVSRGDISGSSFAFRVKNEDTTWIKDGKLWVRTINKFSSIHDVTITTDPAYTQTEVNVRSLEEMEKPEKGDDTQEKPKPYRYKIEKLRMNIH